MKKYEEIILSFILSKSLFFGIAISYIIGNAKKDTCLAIIIGYVIGFFILKLFLSRKIYDIYKNNFSKIIMGLLLVGVFSVIILTFTLQTSNFYLPNTPPIIISSILILTMYYGFTKGFDTIVRYNDILIIVSITLLFWGLLGNLSNVDLKSFMPIIPVINLDFIKSVFATTIVSITPLIIFKSLKYNLDSKNILIGYLLGGLIMILESFMTIGTLGITLSTFYRYPVYIAFKKIKLGIFLERVENLIAAIWIIDFTVFGMLIMLSLNKIFKNNKIILLLSLLIGYLIVKYGTNYYQNTIWLYQYMYYVLGILLSIIFIITKKESLKDSNS